KAGQLSPGGDPIGGRKTLMYNNDCALSALVPTQPMDYFYRNPMGDELLFVHVGSGAIPTAFRAPPPPAGDFTPNPPAPTRRALPDKGEQRMLVVEAFGRAIQPPKRYRNEFGQLLEHSPYCERDLHAPTELPLHEERGEFKVRIKVNHEMMTYTYDYHP